MVEHVVINVMGKVMTNDKKMVGKGVLWEMWCKRWWDMWQEIKKKKLKIFKWSFTMSFKCKKYKYFLHNIHVNI